MNELNSGERPRRVGKYFAAQHRFGARLDRPMVLLHDVIQLLTGSDLDPAPNLRLTTQLEEGAVAGIVPIRGHLHRRPGSQESLPEERLGCLDIAVLAQPEVDRSAVLVHGSIQIRFPARRSSRPNPGS